MTPTEALRILFNAAMTTETPVADIERAHATLRLALHDQRHAEKRCIELAAQVRALLALGGAHV